MKPVWPRGAVRLYSASQALPILADIYDHWRDSDEVWRWTVEYDLGRESFDNEMLSAGAEVATRHYDQQGAVPAA